MGMDSKKLGKMHMFGKFLCILAVTIGLSATTVLPAYASSGVAGGPRATNPNPPEQPISPEAGEGRPATYDFGTGRQMLYWRQVMLDIADKINKKTGNSASIDNIERMWTLIQEENITFTNSEAKLLCLMVADEDEIPDDDVISNWPTPSWPKCGNVLETMFGDDIYAYLSANRNDQYRLDVFRALINGMGMRTSTIQATINKNIEEDGVGQPVNLEGNPYFVHGEECYNSENNIPAVQITTCGVLCTVSTIIIGLLNAASQAIVTATVANPTFTGAVQAAMALYVTIWGAMVVLGLSQIVLGEALIRVAKLGIVAMLITSESVMVFFNMIRCFFIEGMTYLINAVLLVGLEAVQTLGMPPNMAVSTALSAPDAANICSASLAASTNGQGGPLIVLEALLLQVFSGHMALTMLTLFLSSVEGFILVLFLFYGIVMFVLAIITAVTIYLTSLIALYLLLSMMPLFIAFILFERTKDLFRGWISQLTANALGPVFLFAYISLFVVIIEAALAQILDTEICWRKWLTIAWVFDIYKYQYVDMVTRESMVNVLPFGFFEVLIFIILVLVMKEFEGSVKNIADNIAGGLSAGTGIRGWFTEQGAKIRGKAMKATGAAFGGAAKKFQRGQVDRAHGAALEMNKDMDSSVRSNMKDFQHGSDLQKRMYRKHAQAGTLDQLQRRMERNYAAKKGLNGRPRK